MSLPALPLPREWELPLQPAPSLSRPGSQLVRVACPTGLTAWLVSDYAGVREVLGDGRRFSARPGQASHMLAAFDPESEPDSFTRLDGPEHVRIRRNFAPQVSHARRLGELKPLVEDITDRAITRMLASSQPYPLHASFSTAITTEVIAELIGVPPGQRYLLRNAAQALFTTSTTADGLRAALEPLFGYLYQAVVSRRAAPGDDVLSRMILQGESSDRPLTDAELVEMNAALLIAGFDTTASMITFGLVALLNTPGEWDKLVADPALAVPATEELVRYLGVGTGLMRQATEDTKLGGQEIRAGDYVVVSVQSGNRDAALYPDAEVFDIARKPGPHIGFGHGAHACVGQQVARMELNTVLAALATRVPTLRLAVGVSEIEWKRDSVVRGPVELPVAWS
jgi:cytochrome P450